MNLYSDDKDDAPKFAVVEQVCRSGVVHAKRLSRHIVALYTGLDQLLISDSDYVDTEGQYRRPSSDYSHLFSFPASEMGIRNVLLPEPTLL